METGIKARTGNRNRKRTKEKFDFFFDKLKLKVHPDADLLLEFIGKKVDLEARPGAGVPHRMNPTRRSKMNSAVVQFCKEIATQSSNPTVGIESEVDIESIRNSLKKLCPLWPIC